MSRVDLFQAGFPLQGVGEDEDEDEGRAPAVTSVGGIRVIHKICYIVEGSVIFIYITLEIKTLGNHISPPLYSTMHKTLIP